MDKPVQKLFREAAKKFFCKWPGHYERGDGGKGKAIKKKELL